MYIAKGVTGHGAIDPMRLLAKNRARRVNGILPCRKDES
jgi:hypothetical protein